jgi:DUF971 family protein
MLDTIPQDISHDSTQLKIVWKDGKESNFDLLALRKNCPCATCRGGHGGKTGAATGHITEISLLSWKKVGRYAINIVWSDYHDTGIYSYDKLRAFSDGKITEF